MTDVEALKAALKHVEALATAADTQRAVGTKGLGCINVVCQAARGWLAHHETTNSGVTLWSDPCWCNGDQTTGGHRHGSGTGTAQAHHEITDEMSNRGVATPNGLWRLGWLRSGRCWVCGKRTIWAYLDIGYQHPDCDSYPEGDKAVTIIRGRRSERLLGGPSVSCQEMGAVRRAIAEFLRPCPYPRTPNERESTFGPD